MREHWGDDGAISLRGACAPTRVRAIEGLESKQDMGHINADKLGPVDARLVSYIDLLAPTKLSRRRIGRGGRSI